MITREYTTIQVGVVYVDQLGYVLCALCQQQRGREAERLSFLGCPNGVDLSLYPTCDLCGISMHLSVEECRVSYLVEHTPVKIF